MLCHVQFCLSREEEKHGKLESHCGARQGHTENFAGQRPELLMLYPDRQSLGSYTFTWPCGVYQSNSDKCKINRSLKVFKLGGRRKSRWGGW